MGNTRADNTKIFIVPDEMYFFMGDNRDNSKDSRFIGSVPKDNLVGKAQIIFFATEGGSTILEFWKWPFDIQLNRIFKIIK
jgi:signal peptidase I